VAAASALRIQELEGEKKHLQEAISDLQLVGTASTAWILNGNGGTSS
jgi:hypothetical protein